MVITEEFFGVTLKLFVRGIFLLGFISGRCNGRSNDGYSTMSDGIFDGIFPIAHRTFLLSYFRGCWLSEYFCAQSMWTYNEAITTAWPCVSCRN